MRTSVIATNTGVPDGFPRSRHPHTERQDGEFRSTEIGQNSLVACHAHRKGNIALLGDAFHGMEEDLRSRSSSRRSCGSSRSRRSCATNEFNVRTMERIPRLEPSPGSSRTQFRRRVTKLQKVRMKARIDNHKMPRYVISLSFLHKILNVGMVLIVAAKHLLAFLNKIRCPALCHAQ